MLFIVLIFLYFIGYVLGLGTKKGEKFASLLFYLLQLLSDVFRLTQEIHG